MRNLSLFTFACGATAVLVITILVLSSTLIAQEAVTPQTSKEIQAASSSELVKDSADPLNQKEALLKPNILASTSIVAEAIKGVAGDLFNIQTLVPPELAPENFNLDLTKFPSPYKVDYFFRHEEENFLDSTLKDAYLPIKNTIPFEVEGPLMIPINYFQVVNTIMEALIKGYPEHTDQLSKTAFAYKQELENYLIPIQKQIDALAKQGPVIASKKLCKFLAFLKIKVLSDFETRKNLSFEKLTTLIEQEPKSQVKLIVGNYQVGGEETAKLLSEQLNLPYVVLSSYPGTSENNKTYQNLISENINLLAKYLTKPKK